MQPENPNKPQNEAEALKKSLEASVKGWRKPPKDPAAVASAAAPLAKRGLTDPGHNKVH